jgi:hypothetical protein
VSTETDTKEGRPLLRPTSGGDDATPVVPHRRDVGRRSGGVLAVTRALALPGDRGGAGRLRRGSLAAQPFGRIASRRLLLSVLPLWRHARRGAGRRFARGASFRGARSARRRVPLRPARRCRRGEAHRLRAHRSRLVVLPSASLGAIGSALHVGLLRPAWGPLVCAAIALAIGLRRNWRPQRPRPELVRAQGLLLLLVAVLGGASSSPPSSSA